MKKHVSLVDDLIYHYCFLSILVNPNAHFRNGTNAPTYVYGNQIIITDNQTVVCGNQTIVAGPAPDQKRAKKDLELTEDQQGKHEGLLGTSRDTSDFLDAQNIPKIGE